mgnify:CR=1 FL=1
MNLKQKKIIKTIIMSATIIIILLPIIFPLYFVLISSLKNMADVYQLPPKLFGFQPIFDHYKYIFETQHYGIYMWNSAIIAVTSTLFSMLISIPAAYAISRYKMNKVMMSTLVVRLLPNISILIPFYYVYSKIGLVDTYFGLGLANSIPAISTTVWIMAGFVADIPYDLEEAAIVDGCTRQGAFRRIILPVSVPGLVTCATLAFLTTWNNFQYPLILGGQKTQTLPVSLQYFVSGSGVKWGRMLAATMVVILPTIILTMLLQKYIVKGLTAGAVKG